MALVLTRRPGESIMIGADVKVTVIGQKGDQVKFAVEAPRHIAVDREEVHQRKLEEAKAS